MPRLLLETTVRHRLVPVPRLLRQPSRQVAGRAQELLEHAVKVCDRCRHDTRATRSVRELQDAHTIVGQPEGLLDGRRQCWRIHLREDLLHGAEVRVAAVDDGVVRQLLVLRQHRTLERVLQLLLLLEGLLDGSAVARELRGPAVARLQDLDAVLRRRRGVVFQVEDAPEHRGALRRGLGLAGLGLLLLLLQRLLDLCKHACRVCLEASGPLGVQRAEVHHAPSVLVVIDVRVAGHPGEQIPKVLVEQRPRSETLAHQGNLALRVGQATARRHQRALGRQSLPHKNSLPVLEGAGVGRRAEGAVEDEVHVRRRQ
mmetsp:Transcript_100712/g.307856  ORF Transcript_100712/g.307856 Transcript_100712/m.307856 type:complete len:314 (-) Transcript_100712:884-1825(-)